MSDTPRTDKMSYEVVGNFSRRRKTIVVAAFAKHLERELAAERALADRLARELESWSRIAGDYTPMDADEALDAWKEARK